MKQPSVIVSGILAVFALSFVTLAMVPAIQLGGLQPAVNEEMGDIYPIDVAGQQAQGRRVYVAQGCVACHTEQIRDPLESADLDRGWGVRRTVARDYIYENPPLLGSMRNGPDLANIGARKDKDHPEKYTAAWHYRHLYNPNDVAPGSIMPSFTYLFEKRRIVGQPDADALKLVGDEKPEPGWQIVPTADARALVGYLTTLDHSHALPEAGKNIVPPAAATGGTNSK